MLCAKKKNNVRRSASGDPGPGDLDLAAPRFGPRRPRFPAGWATGDNETWQYYIYKL